MTAQETIYDNLGRLTDDEVTSLGWTEQVNDHVLAIETVYDDQGEKESVTSYNSATGRDPTDNIVNQVEYSYDDWGNVEESEQSHSGAVAEGTPSVQYGYDSKLRLTTVTDPTNGEVAGVVGYNYGESNSLQNSLSQVTAVTNGGSTTYAAYTYLGAGTVVDTAHPAVASGLDLSYGNVSNNYAGLDQWGNTADQAWNTGAVYATFSSENYITVPAADSFDAHGHECALEPILPVLDYGKR